MKENRENNLIMNALWRQTGQKRVRDAGKWLFIAAGIFIVCRLWKR